MSDDQLLAPDQESAEALKRALETLRKDGWGRGKFYDFGSGKCCSLGALGYPFHHDHTNAVAYLAYAIRQDPGYNPLHPQRDDMHCVLVWNDHWLRKWPEVERVFLAAIRYAEGGGVHVRSGVQG